MRLHSKVKRQNTTLRTDRMGYLCSYWCLKGICHGADDWKAKAVCKAFFCPSSVLCMSAQPHVHSHGCRYGRLASNPEVLCSTILCRAQDMYWWNTFCHFDVYLCDTVLHSYKQNYKPNVFLSLIFFFSKTGVKKEVQKDQDASRPAVSSPKKSAVTATKLHSPGIYEPESTVSGKI